MFPLLKRYRELCFIYVYFGVVLVEAQTQFTFSVDTGAGLVYLLLIVFFSVNFCTPVARWIYLTFLQKLVARALKQVERVSKRLTERMSDVGRRSTQSIRKV